MPGFPVSLAIALVIATGTLAQQAPSLAAAKERTFEVATLKPNPHTNGPWRLNPTASGYAGMNISLLDLVREAYGIYDPKLLTGGPVWIDHDKFDLEAKFDAAEMPNAADLTYRQRADMLQPLLRDRFHLKVHHETRSFPVYDLIVAKNGLKLHQTRPEDVVQLIGGPGCHFLRSNLGYIKVQGCTPKDLEGLLLGATGRTVIDETKITTRYNFELRWAPDNVPADSPEALNPSIFAALQEQLGLKLEPATAPLSALVIDSAEKPSEN